MQGGHEHQADEATALSAPGTREMPQQRCRRRSDGVPANAQPSHLPMAENSQQVLATPDL